MYLWRRLVTENWWIDNETGLADRVGANVAVIERANRKRLQIEVASASRGELRALAREFGGSIEKLPRNWLERFSHQHKAKPLKIGGRRLIIPAGGAFGTGEHATTAMSLRLLEQLTRKWKRGWSIVDLGTGTGILALAAANLGAKRVLGLDNDPLAISTAKENARRNKIENVNFRFADVHRWKPVGNIDIVTANLFSELLIAVVPKVKKSRWLILSGILHNQEREVTRALNRNKIDIVQVRRRGKWVALLARQLRRS